MEILNLIDWIQKAGFTGLLIIIAVPKLKKKIFGNGENGEHKDYSKDICDLSKHASIANEEMGDIKERMEAVEKNLVEINTKLDIVMRHMKL